MASATAIVGKWGNAAALRIPQPFCDQLGIGVGSRVRVSATPERIIIEPASAQWTLRERMKQWDGKRFETREYDWGDPQGDELW